MKNKICVGICILFSINLCAQKITGELNFGTNISNFDIVNESEYEKLGAEYGGNLGVRLSEKWKLKVGIVRFVGNHLFIENNEFAVERLDFGYTEFLLVIERMCWKSKRNIYRQLHLNTGVSVGTIGHVFTGEYNRDGGTIVVDGIPVQRDILNYIIGSTFRISKHFGITVNSNIILDKFDKELYYDLSKSFGLSLKLVFMI